MKIRRLKIQTYEKLHNKSLELSPGINVLYGNKNQRTAVTDFLKEMLYGSQKRMSGEEEYGGVLWFERGGEEFRLTRKFNPAKPYHELRSETTGAITDAERGSLDRVLGSISEQVYRNAVEISSLRSVTARDTVREIQGYMAGYETAGDSSLDLGRAEQMLKMSRKGYQAQEDRRVRELEKGQATVSTQMQELEQEMEKYRAQMRALEEKEESFSLGEEGDSILDQKMQGIQKKMHAVQLGGIVAFVLCLVMAIAVPFSWYLKVLLAVAGAMFLGAGVSYRSALRKDLQKKRRMAEKWAVRQDKMSDEKGTIERSFEECARHYVNLRGEMRDYDAQLQEPTPEDSEVRAINMAMEMIGELSGRIYARMNPALQRKMSVILKEISGGSYGTIHMDDNLHMSVFSEGQEIALERLERPVLQMVYFALRMAASELLCPGEEVPVILEDVLASFEPSLLPGILTWMSKDPRQFLISTESEHEMELLREMGVAFQELS